jgi:hypothetical protein
MRGCVAYRNVGSRDALPTTVDDDHDDDDDDEDDDDDDDGSVSADSFSASL